MITKPVGPRIVSLIAAAALWSLLPAVVHGEDAGVKAGADVEADVGLDAEKPGALEKGKPEAGKAAKEAKKPLHRRMDSPGTTTTEGGAEAEGKVKSRSRKDDVGRSGHTRGSVTDPARDVERTVEGATGTAKGAAKNATGAAKGAAGGATGAAKDALGGLTGGVDADVDAEAGAEIDEERRPR